MIAASAALVAATTALWVRRDTWASRWESAATLNVALQGLNVLVLYPHISRRISPCLHAVTGLWNVEDLIGHIAYLIGLVSLLYMALSRLKMTDPERRLYLRQRLELPASIYFPLLIGCFVVSDCGNDYVSDLVFAPVTPALACYWLLMVVGAAYLLGNTVWALLILRRDPRSIRVATLYLAAVCGSICCLACVVVSFVVDGLNVAAWLLIRAEVVAYAAVAAYSWHRKIALLRGRTPRRAGT
jgi:hypothetical protein